MNDELKLDEEGARLRDQLQKAVRSTEVPPFLEARIRNSIRQADERPSHRFGWMAAAAAAVALFFGGAVAYQLGHLRLTTGSQDSYIASISNQVASIMRVGLRDHVHCAIFRKYPKNPPKVEELAAKLRPEYRPMVPIVQKSVPSGFRLMMSHECGYKGRKFVHLALKRDSELLSVVMAKKGDGESFKTEELLPALSESGISFYKSGAQRFQIAAFESRDHLVYVISDLPERQNMQTMLAMAPALNAFLQNLEL